MKKNIIILGCMIILTVVISGCGNNADNKSSKTRESSEITYIEVDKLPYDMAYNDKTIPLTEVDVYQSETDYGYGLYATVKLDTTNINDKDLHWLDQEAKNFTTEKTLSSKFEISNADNALKDKRLTCIGSCDFGDSLVYYYMTIDELKHEISQLKINLDVKLEQDELYDKNNRHKENRYSYTQSYDKAEQVKDIKDMPENIKTNLNKVMRQFNTNLKKLIN